MLDQITASFKNFSQSVVDKIKSFNKPTEWFISVGTYLVGGFIAGFILKYYAKYLILTILALFLLLTFFNHYSIININYNLLNQVYGLSQPITINEIIDICVVWLRSHIAQFVAACVGIFLAAELA